MGKADKVHKNKCPKCRREMDYIYGDLICSYCGYRTSYSERAKSENAVKQPITSDVRETIAPDIKKKWKISKKLVMSIAGVLALCAVFLFGLCIWKGASCYRTTTETVTVLTEVYDTLAQQKLAADSEGLCEVLRLIFQKEINKITSRDLATVTFLDFRTENGTNVVRYQRFDPDSGELMDVGEVCPQNVDFSEMDFSALPNLSTLCMDYGSIKSLKGLKKLNVLCTDLTPSEIASFMNPEQLDTLILLDLSEEEDLSGIDAFKKISMLIMRAENVTDISKLAALENLQTLQIINGNQINSFDVLYSMPSLRSILIDSVNLDNIEFAAHIPFLTTLQVYNSKVEDISCLKSCYKTLKSLNLSNNYEIKNYDVVSNLTNLNTLTLRVKSEKGETIKLPNMKQLTGVTNLDIGCFNDLSELCYLVNLDSLAIWNSSILNLPLLPSLRNLYCYNSFVDSDALEALMGMDSLTTISFEKSQICCSIEEVFKLPSLREFNMVDSVAGFDVSNLTLNSQLNTFNINYSELRNTKDKSFVSLDELEYLPLAENTAIFEYFPKLNYLYLAGQNLNDIGFVTAMPRIYTLDISDNFVTDLTPLSDLQYLHEVIDTNQRVR